MTKRKIDQKDMMLVSGIAQAVKMDALVALYARKRSTGEEKLVLSISLHSDDNNGEVFLQPICIVEPTSTNELLPPDDATVVEGEDAKAIRDAFVNKIEGGSTN